MERRISFDISNDILLGIKELYERQGISKSTLNRIRRNDIPNQVPFQAPTVWLGHGDSSRWSSKSINLWIYNQGQSYRAREFNKIEMTKIENIEDENEPPNS